ncbi:MAG: 3-deoxy-manno-octulosonate cytidylyltransferase [Thermoanaerobaculales bacterium]|jgi:3-deoxy-manno-octulosonate cytidylyltransferase (CMP-KDO synthetase)|nr:3-deoxy-manno-octulosonate cytidylyltransferase [Thermoanaerobaculales bacterium]
MTVQPRRVVAAIPARWGSTRFPGKALAALAGEPMIAHVVRRALAADSIDHVIVATDDERVAQAASSSGAETVMTGVHPSGTDRIAEAVACSGEWELVVNVQGDEPMLSAANIDTLVRGMRICPSVGMATLCRPLAPGAVDDPNAVKVVRGADERALYFSRSVIPYPRRLETAAALWRLHLGIYGFRPDVLERFVSLEPSALEQAEGLEQLRALENGIDILVLDAPDAAHGVDTPEDLERVHELMMSGV